MEEFYGERTIHWRGTDCGTPAFSVGDAVDLDDVSFSVVTEIGTIVRYSYPMFKNIDVDDAPAMSDYGSWVAWWREHSLDEVTFMFTVEERYARDSYGFYVKNIDVNDDIINSVTLSVDELGQLEDWDDLMTLLAEHMGVVPERPSVDVLLSIRDAILAENMVA